MNKHQYSLSLLRSTIDHAPNFFPQGRKKEMEEVYATYAADPTTDIAYIEDALVTFGKEIWPFRKSFWHIHDTDGRHNEEAYFLELLSPALRARYDLFKKKGNKIEDVAKDGEFETFFSPEERVELTTAKLTAHERVLKGIEELCAGEHKELCTQSLGKYREHQARVEELIAQLRGLAEQSIKWRPEILDKARTFAAGWSGLEKEIAEEDVRNEIEYYQGVLALTEPGE